MLIDGLREITSEERADGLTLYRFDRNSGVEPGSYDVSGTGSNLSQIELFFCCEGALTLHCKKRPDIDIGRDEIVLLTSAVDAVELEVREKPIGYGLVFNQENCRNLIHMYQKLGCPDWDYERVQTFLSQRDGYMQMKHGSWSLSTLAALRGSDRADQGTYCVLKAAEILYLLNTRQEHTEEIAQQPAMPDYLAERLVCAGHYIKEHLDEKLTISNLCKQFNLSPTTLKTKFREFYGLSIHKWILQQRTCRAAELLKSTDMTILQIAQSVGYESVSQFNVVFRRTFGMAPNLYRKNVQNKKQMTDSVGKDNFSIL